MCLACHLCVRVPRVLSDTAETHRAVALVHGVRVYCTGCGAVRESSHIYCVLLCVFCGWGAAEGLTQKVSRLPTLRGGPSAVATGRPCRESPGLFVLSLSHYVDRAAVGCQPPQARLLPY